MTETDLPLNLQSHISAVDAGRFTARGCKGRSPLQKTKNLPLPKGKGVGGMGIKVKYTIGKEGIARKAGVCYLNCNTKPEKARKNF